MLSYEMFKEAKKGIDRTYAAGIRASQTGGE